MKLSPWFDGEVWDRTREINYPVWVQQGQTPRRLADHPAKGLKRWILTRNTLDVPVPDGWPTAQGDVLLDIIAPDDGEQPAAIYALWYPGCGFNMHCTAVEPKPLRQISEAGKQSIRRKALTRRVEAAAPLFAPTIIASELAAQPDYFGTPKGN